MGNSKIDVLSEPTEVWSTTPADKTPKHKSPRETNNEVGA